MIDGVLRGRWALTLALVGLACGAARAEVEGPGGGTARVTLAVSQSCTRGLAPELVKAVAAGFMDYLSAQTEWTFQLAMVEDAEEIRAGMMAGRYQFALANVFEFLHFERQWPNLKPRVLAVPRIGFGLAAEGGTKHHPRDALRMLLVARRGGEIQQVEDLRGKRIAIAGTQTLAARVYLRALAQELAGKERGDVADGADGARVALPFGEVVVKRSGRTALSALDAGQVDVVCVDEATVGILAAHGMLGVKRGVEGFGEKYLTVAKSQRFMVDPLFHLEGRVRPEVVAALRGNLLGMHENPAGGEILRFFRFEGWAVPTEQTLGPARQMLRYYEPPKRAEGGAKGSKETAGAGESKAE